MNKSKINPVYEDTYYIVPRYIRKLVGKHLIFLDVYETIFQFWNKGKICFLSNKAISERTGASERQIKEALTFFEKNGELKRECRGLKRFLIKPEVSIEIDGGAPPPSCNKINQAGAPPPIEGRSTALEGGAPPPTEYKEVEYKEINNNISNKNLISVDYPETYYPLPSKKSKTLKPVQLLENNPHGIPAQMIHDWLVNRKAKKTPVTQTVWNRLNKELQKCSNPLDAFEMMVASGWQSFKAEWVNQNPNNNKKSFFDNESVEYGKDSDKEIF